MRILLLKGKSQYNALRAFLDDAHRALEALGHEVINDRSEARFQRLIEIAKTAWASPQWSSVQ